jgi:biofilm PGA synthesis protein PgaD
MSRSAPEGYPLIIDRPELQARHRRVVYSTATLVAWALWMYLWLPLVSLLAWWFGIRSFVREFVVPETPILLRTLLIYGMVVAILALALVVWSRYNLRRFGPRGRRQAPNQVSDREIARWFGVPEDQLPSIRSADSQVVRFLEDGRIEWGERRALARAGD